MGELLNLLASLPSVVTSNKSYSAFQYHLFVEAACWQWATKPGFVGDARAQALALTTPSHNFSDITRKTDFFSPVVATWNKLTTDK